MCQWFRMKTRFDTEGKSQLGSGALNENAFSIAVKQKQQLFEPLSTQINCVNSR